MVFCKNSLALFCLLSLACLILLLNAQDSTQDYLKAHSQARAAVGVGPMTWDNNVAAFARNHANQRASDCNLVHSSNRPYGENLAKSSGNLSAKDAVKMWVDERACYNNNSNSCAAGKQCGHYTPVVWRNSVRLGCAKNSLALFFLLSLACQILPFNAQDSPQDYLNAHNQVRAAVGVGPLTWDNKVAAFARNYANQRAGDCNLVHSSNRPYGEILAKSSGNLSGKDAVKMWVDERAYYNYNSNSCAAGKQCGHYTQVVWRNSVRLGCAKVKCNNGGTFIGCNYDPPGNFVGQRPY
ncbi:hypothetical protein GH714_008688 [Hevea brasiliensis]|uniref:SCP domain-containing protein n=1 Tax=Hevea brasiliensis TaxID=3981 RepID=A0A6A6KYY0_HEVBR|nr:hypothetical protein GH714_008688 [Hevea brasiliensis]